MQSALTPQQPQDKVTTPETTAQKSEEARFYELYRECLHAYDDHIMDLAYEKSLPAISLLNRLDPAHNVYSSEFRRLEEIGFEHSEMLRYVRHFDEEDWHFDRS